MNKVKILAFGLAVLMILSVFAACSEKPASDPTKESTPAKQPEATTPGSKETEGTAPAAPSEKIVINSKEAFLAAAEELLDLSLYDELDISGENSNHKSYYYYIAYENEQNYDLDYTVALGDGTAFTMPVAFSELAQNGWSFQPDSSDEMLDAGYMTFVALINGSGQTISATICNMTEKAVAFKDATVIAVRNYQYDGLEPSEKNEDAIDFTVCGSLTNLSSLEEIIECLGNPSDLYATIWYDDESETYEYTEIQIEYTQVDSAQSSLIFTLSGDGNYIISMEYGVEPS